MIKIHDIVYGDLSIQHGCIEELINAPTVQRLKYITQEGVPGIWNFMPTSSRFEHSQGVMIFLRLLNSTLEEQVAGLLHDLSHLAFCHVAEYVLSTYSVNKETFNESLMSRFFEKSDIQQILKKYKIKPERVLDFMKADLIGCELPDLSVDRVDYALRHGITFLGYKNANKFLQQIRIQDGNILCFDYELTKEFSEMFLYLNNNYWACYDSSYRYRLLSEMLKEAIKIKLISNEDLFGTEAPIIAKLISSGNAKIASGLTTLSNTNKIENPHLSEGIIEKKKFRYVDPVIAQGSGHKRLSEISTEFKLALEDARKLNQQGFILPESPIYSTPEST